MNDREKMEAPAI